MKTCNAFLAECATHAPDTLLSVEEAATYERDVADIGRHVLAVVKPWTQDDVRTIVDLANRHGISLHPVSQGKNWGLGSRLPSADACVVLDLGRLNRIVEFSAEYGYLRIEPGVTQRQIFEYLKGRDDWYLDVNGSGADTSLVGNALERGTAYNSLRAETVHSFKVLTGGGELLHTGQNSHNGSGLGNILHHATGPDLTELFIQSGFGIVLEATVDLTPVPEYAMSFTITVAEEADLPEAIQKVRMLMGQHDIMGVPHIFDRERLHSALAPLLDREILRESPSANGSGKEQSANGQTASRTYAEYQAARTEVTAIINKYIKGSWWIVGSLQGARSVVRARAGRIRKAFKGFAKVQLDTPAGARRILRVLELLRLRQPARIMRATQIMRDLPLGVPSNESLYSVYWPFAERMEYDAEPDVDASPTGYRFVVPGIPLDTESVSRLLGIFEHYRSLKNIRLAASINPMNTNVGEGVFSLSYPRNAATLELAQDVERAFLRELTESGYGMMRLGIHQMDTLEHVCPDTIYRLKELFDPNGIISPGRYLPSIGRPLPSVDAS